MRISIVFICVFALFSGNLLFGQELLRADVVSNENASYGFDAYQVEEWSDHYEQVELNDSVLYFVPYLSVTEDRVDSIDIQFSSVFNLDQLSFSVDDSLWELPIVSHSDSSVRTVLPKMHSDYSIEILVRDSLVGKLNVIVYPIQQERLVIVPMVKMELNIDSLQSWLNSVYRPAYLSLEIELGELFSPEDFDDTLKNW